MREINPAIIIFSVYQAARPEYANKDNHDCVLTLLKQFGISYKTVKGRYNGADEESIIVGAHEYRVVEKLCKQFRQECYLRSDESRASELVYADGSTLEVGFLHESAEVPGDNYTYDEVNGSYWITGEVVNG